MRNTEEKKEEKKVKDYKIYRGEARKIEKHIWEKERVEMRRNLKSEKEN